MEQFEQQNGVALYYNPKENKYPWVHVCISKYKLLIEYINEWINREKKNNLPYRTIPNKIRRHSSQGDGT